MKTCTKCGVTKTLDFFYKDRKGKLGVRSNCKECVLLYAKTDEVLRRDRESKAKSRPEKRDLLNERSKNWYWENVEYARQCSSEWAKNNKDKKALQSKRSYVKNKEAYATRSANDYAKNKERYQERSRRYRLENREIWKVYARRYAQKHPEKMAAMGAYRRAALTKSTPSWANQFFIEEAYRLARMREEVCGGLWNVDHIVPLRSKIVCGLHVEHNLQVIPRDVNFRKGNRYWPDMP